MGRLHLIEIHDQPWCPKSIRDGATDYLRFIINLSKIYEPVVGRLKTALEATETDTIVDICSGGGGPWSTLHGLLKQEGCDVSVRMTDKFPNLEAFERVKQATDGNVGFIETSVDATDLPKELQGFRTLFSSFHHFKPEMARAILADAAEKGQGIGIFEATARRPLSILPMIFAPLVVMLLTPFIRPFRLSRLFWTYIIPAIPLVVLFDGVVSCLRTYSPQELRDLTADLGGPDYHWEAGETAPKGPAPPILWLIGVPTKTRA